MINKDFFNKLFYKPKSTKLTITSNNGFHLRPAAKLSSIAKSYSCQITATFKNKNADAKAVNALLSLSLEQGDEFTLTCRGKESLQALDELQNTFLELMKNDIEVETIVQENTNYESNSLSVDIISTGIAVAPIYHYKEIEVNQNNNTSFDEAIKNTLIDLEKEAKNSDIFLAQNELLLSLKSQANSLQELESLIESSSAKLLGGKLEAKIIDYKDILQRVKKHLGLELKVEFPSEAFILIADDLLPSQIDSLAKTLVKGVVLKSTAFNSHTAILLRGSGISSAIADGSKLVEGSRVILDANSAQLIPNPSKNDFEKAQKLLISQKEKENIAYKKRFEPAFTKNSKEVKVFANITDEESALRAKDEGADGIGLLRTEFLFKETKPSLQEQIDAYSKVFNLYNDITVRTIDVGGDKELPYIKLGKENNPFLGIRGIRLLKTHPYILEEQLLAIFKASNGKKIKVMFPMISTIEEFIEAKEFAKNIASKSSIDISHILFGIMIEVPSVLFLLKEFNELVDFYSIGTNDLTQYLFAIERTHKTLKTDELSSVVFSAIEKIVKESNKPLSICGELAGNKKAIKKLIALGVETLSVSEKNIAQTKEEIRHV